MIVLDENQNLEGQGVTAFKLETPDETVLVLADIEVLGTLATVLEIGDTADRARVSVSGDLVAQGGSAAVISNAAEDVVIDIDDGATVLGSYPAIVSWGRMTLVNHGSIEGYTYGAINVTAAFNLTNYGTISSFYTVVAHGTDKHTFANFGTISVPAYIDNGSISYAAFRLGDGVDEVFNAGSIVGDIRLGAGNDLYQGRGGTLAGAIYGGAGNDTYKVDRATTIVESENEGTDLVQASASFVLSGYVENLTLVGSADIDGTGNAQANVITGNSGANTLYGGSAGSDKLIGGLGDDTYIIDRVGIAVTEAASAGIDTVRSSLSYTLGANVENLILLGAAANGTGNALVNTLTGNDVNNILNGGADADTMLGYGGNDTYYVDNIGDRVLEKTDNGTDTVRTSINYSLGVNVENLIINTTGNIGGSGNGLNNAISGGTGANALTGYGGADKLMGGTGADTFVFTALGDSTVAAAGRDTILDFTKAQGDRIDLRGMDANTALANDQAFTFIGSADFTSIAGQLRYTAAGANTLVSGDVSGDGTADFAILLVGQITLQQTDLFL